MKFKREEIGFWWILLVGVPIWWFTTRVYRVELMVVNVIDVWKSQSIGIWIEGVEGIKEMFELAMSENGMENGVFVWRRDGIKWNWRVETGENGIVRNGIREWVVRAQNTKDGNEFIRKSLVGEMQKMVERMRSKGKHGVKRARKYKILITLVNGDCDRLVTDWEIEEAIGSYLLPFVKVLDFFEFEVSSQIQSDFSNRNFKKLGDGWGLDREDCRYFVDTNEWNTAASVGLDPMIHFVIYVPPKENMPLYVYDENGTRNELNAFLVSGWGGVSIAPVELYGVLKKLDLKPFFELFLPQLLKLVDLDIEPKVLVSGGIDYADEGILRLILTNYEEAANSLQALKSTLTKLTNVQITDRVAELVSSAMYHLQNTFDSLNASDFKAAVYHSQLAYEFAQKAFIDPTLTGTLYFPDEHKLAVYLPLFGPILLTMGNSAFKKIKATVG